jgi:dipeptidyl-peptidase III
MTKKDLALVKEFMEHKKIDLLNTRAFKDEKGKFIISVGSIDTQKSEYNQVYKG